MYQVRTKDGTCIQFGSDTPFKRVVEEFVSHDSSKLSFDMPDGTRVIMYPMTQESVFNVVFWDNHPESGYPRYRAIGEFKVQEDLK